MASAALIASRRVMTARAHESKSEQEQLVKDRLIQESFKEVPPRDIPTLDQAPELGEFCGESMFGSRKADVVIRLWDRRELALECKVSNSSTNSVKRLNNDAAVKAGIWLGEFGTAQTVPAAMLAGVFKRHNLEQAQGGGLTLFWSHDLDELISFIDSTRP
jgi:XamI-like restriction endonuclease